MAARSTRSMTENNITHIVSVCADPIPGEAPASGICHMRIPVEDVDYADLLIHLPSACQFIDQALRSGGVVFVHCVQGISRSAAVVAAYCRLSIFIFQLTSFNHKHAVMWSRRIRCPQALDIVRNGKRYTHFNKRCWVRNPARNQIWPNIGFQEQLVLFELCQYMPSPSNGIYTNWRSQLERKLRAAGLW